MLTLRSPARRVYIFASFSVIIVLLVSQFIPVYNKTGEAIQQDNPNKKLQQVLIVSRHGKRTPTKTFHYDQYKDKDLWPEGLGQLTKEGKLQLFELGKNYRKRYSEFLLPTSKNVLKDVKSFSTQYDRCFQSAALILAGIYPPEGDQIWDNGLLWQPIPISMDSPDKVNIISSGSCPRYSEKLKSIKIDDSETESLIKHFAKYISSEQISSIAVLYQICDTIVTEVNLNLAQPKWIDDVYPQILGLIKRGLKVATSNSIMKRLISGPLVTEIVSQMNKVVNKEDFNKLYLHAGHDTTIHSLIDSLGIPYEKTPDYGSSVIFELYTSKKTDDHLVRILYNNDVLLKDVTPLILPECEEYCPFKQFLHHTKSLIVTDWNQECKV